MAYIFDGPSKIISLTTGTTILDVRDLYSRWKDWVISDGSSYPQAMSVVGGEPVDPSQGIYVSSYFFLENSWKIRPQEANHKLSVTNGTLVTADGSDPFLQTLGTYNVLIQYSQPVKAETVSTGGGGGATPAQIWSYDDRQLTSFSFISSSTVDEDSIVTKVWNNPDRQLTSFSFISSSTIDEDSIVEKVWDYNSRTLTFPSSAISNISFTNAGYVINDSVVFSYCTNDSTGSASPADSPPTYRVYENTDATPLLTGTMTRLDSANTPSLYIGSIVLSASTGFEAKKTYTIFISATVKGITGTTTREFNIAENPSDSVYTTETPNTVGWALNKILKLVRFLGVK